MNKFYHDNGPHIKSPYNTSKMMKHLIIALFPIIIFSVYKNGILPYSRGYGTLLSAFRPLIMILLGMLTSLISETLFIYFVLKIKDKEKLITHLKYSYAIFPGLFLALTIPINTPYSILIVGAMVATIIGKMLFGGFGFNIFNPALVGNLFIISAYYSNIAIQGGYLNKLELDTITQATPLTNLQNLNYIDTYQNIVTPFGNLWNFLTGMIPGTIGETSAILCLLGLIYLLFTKVITWHIPIIYLATVFILTSFIGYYHDLGIWYPLFHLLSGGLIFGAIFMATDPVTSPTTPIGQAIYALGLGFLTVIFRFLTSYPEGVLTAILTMNMFVFIIDKLGVKVRFNLKKLSIPLAILILIIGTTTYYVATNINKKVTDQNFNVIDVTEIDNQVIYTVTHKADHGLIKAKIEIDDNTGKITTIDILEQNEYVWNQIEEHNYIDKLIQQQHNLDDLDTISGATYTANYLKQMVIKTLKEYSQNR